MVSALIPPPIGQQLFGRDGNFGGARRVAPLRGTDPPRPLRREGLEPHSRPFPSHRVCSIIAGARAAGRVSRQAQIQTLGPQPTRPRPHHYRISSPAAHGELARPG
eukprot:3042615-Pyramimonas_sp.AAC.1